MFKFGSAGREVMVRWVVCARPDRPIVGRPCLAED